MLNVPMQGCMGLVDQILKPPPSCQCSGLQSISSRLAIYSGSVWSASMARGFTARLGTRPGYSGKRYRVTEWEVSVLTVSEFGVQQHWRPGVITIYETVLEESRCVRSSSTEWHSRDSTRDTRARRLQSFTCFSALVGVTHLPFPQRKQINGVLGWGGRLQVHSLENGVSIYLWTNSIYIYVAGLISTSDFNWSLDPPMSTSDP